MSATATAPLRLLLPQVVPLALAVIILQFFGLGSAAENLKLITSTNDSSSFKSLEHFGDIMLLAGAAVCHICICTVAIWRFVTYTVGHKSQAHSMLFLCSALIFTAVVGAMIVLPGNGLAVFQLTYFIVRDLVAGGLSSSPLLPEFAFGASALSLSAWALSGFGVAAVVAATMAASIAARPLPIKSTDGVCKEESEAWKAEFAQRLKLLQGDLYILSLVLVSSSISASLYFHIPVSLYAEELQPPVTAYLDDLTLFWAAIYTLTLIASIIPAYLYLRSQAKSYARSKLKIEQPGEIRIWLSSLTMNSPVSEQIMNFAVLLAPLFAGPLGNTLQGVLGGA